MPKTDNKWEQKPNYKNNNDRTKMIRTKIWQNGTFERNGLSENILQTRKHVVVSLVGYIHRLKIPWYYENYWYCFY